MLRRLKLRLDITLSKLCAIPPYCYFVPILLLAAALIIRAATGPTHLIYNALGGRGIFPGPFLYLTLYIIRLLLCGALLSFSLFNRYLYENRIKALALSVTAAVLLLLEYKLLFGGLSLILTIAFTLLTALISIVLMLIAKNKSTFIFISCMVFFALQLLFFVQLISLSMCI